jgi:hypothetical protein
MQDPISYADNNTIVQENMPAAQEKSAVSGVEHSAMVLAKRTHRASLRTCLQPI